MKEFSYEEVEAATKGFAMEMLVGKGSHGRVYKGVLRCGKQVAVKKPLPGMQSLGNGSSSKLENEIQVLESINSPHLVNLEGVSCNEEEKLLVMEFMPNGSLHDLLHVSSETPSWYRRMVMALQIAQAVEALHDVAPPIIHRDIKSSNILLDSQWNAKLADFSLSVRDISSSTLQQEESPAMPAPAPAGTIGYLDPCYTGPGKLCTKNDIFSYGVVLLELISGRRVMDSAYDTTSIVAWAPPLVRNGLVVEVCDSRMALSCEVEVVIGRVLRMASRCVSLEEERRPSAGEITAELWTIVEHLRHPTWNHLRDMICRRVYTCMSLWRMCRKTRVTATRIVCTNHLYDDDDGDDQLD